mmetsp:Transcript_31461/g.70779  ORF Transcript_31461/g.70779 Transcript_31461/m.70779 type:complete len:223 (+) Transcript_31461:1946-2614(+)
MREISAQVVLADLPKQLCDFHVSVDEQKQNDQHKEENLYASPWPSEEVDGEGVDIVVPGYSACLLPVENKLVMREDILRRVVRQELHSHFLCTRVDVGAVLRELDHVLSKHLREPLVEVQLERVFVGRQDVLGVLVGLLEAAHVDRRLFLRDEAVVVLIEEVRVVLLREEADREGELRPSSRVDHVPLDGSIELFRGKLRVVHAAERHERRVVSVGSVVQGC